MARESKAFDIGGSANERVNPAFVNPMLSGLGDTDIRGAVGTRPTRSYSAFDGAEALTAATRTQVVQDEVGL